MSSENVEVNSQFYWDQRFAGDWQAHSGRQQTAFFAQVARDFSPGWLFDEIRTRRLSVCDWGCACGEATAEFARAFPENEVAGYDISSVAIAEARQSYPDLAFSADDLLVSDVSFDVVFSSNTLEHFHDPISILERLRHHAREFIWLMLPFYDDSGEKEHFARFDYRTVPATLGDDFVLAYLRDVDTSRLPGTAWLGRQVLLVYAHRDALERLAQRNALQVAPDANYVSPSMEIGTRRLAQSVLELGDVCEELSAIRTRNAGLASELQQARDASERALAAATASRLRADEAEAELELARWEAEEIGYPPPPVPTTSPTGGGEACGTVGPNSAETRASMWELHVRALETSRSWRVTAPLRALRRRLRGEMTDPEPEPIADPELRAAYWERRARALLSSTSWRVTAPLRGLSLLVNPRQQWTPPAEEGSIRGFASAATEPAGSAPHATESTSIHEAELEAILVRYAGRPIVVFSPRVDWDIPLFQRPQHIARALAQRGYLYFFCSPNHGYDKINTSSCGA